jgi:hypothetical protein
MNSDQDLGPVDPGVDQLFRTLTAPAAPGELTGEQQALAMFRATRPPSVSVARPVQPAVAPARGPGRRRFRLAGAVIVAAVGGLAAAAYTAILPAPVQNFAYRDFGFLGVPAHHHLQPSPMPTTPGRSIPPGGRHRTSPAQSGPASSPSVRTSPRPSQSPSPTAAPGADLLSATASASNITAGTAVTISGTLTKAGKDIAGATVKLLERPARQARWHVVGTGQTNSSGNVAVGVPALVTNAAFRLKGPDGARSPVVRVTVSPPVTIDLEPGAQAVRDVLLVTTQFARPGNVVMLQVQTANGNWADLRGRRLNASGDTQFVLDGRRLKNKSIRVELLATARHASSLSNQVTVPAPA